MHLLATRGRQFVCELNLHSLRKLMIAITGGSVVLVGIALLVLPGPAILVIPAGQHEQGNPHQHHAAAGDCDHELAQGM